MTRKEQIEKAADERFDDTGQASQSWYRGFVEGAEWADANPKLKTLKEATYHNLERISQGQIKRLEARLAIAIGVLTKISSQYYCRETGRYEDDAKEALAKIRGEK